MFIFVRKLKELLCIPEKNVSLIKQCESQITIFYLTGSVEVFPESQNSCQVLSSEHVRYPDESSAVAKMRDFYSALSKNATVFIF